MEKNILEIDCPYCDYITDNEKSLKLHIQTSSICISKRQKIFDNDHSSEETNPFTSEINISNSVFLDSSSFTNELFVFANSCVNGGPLSSTNMSKFLNLIQRLSMQNPEQIHLKTLVDMKNYEKKMKDQIFENEKLLKMNVKELNDEEPIIFQYRNAQWAVEKMFGHIQNSQHDFILKSKKSFSDMGRMYSTPDTGDWWIEMEKVARKVKKDAILVGLIIYSDQTYLSQDFHTKAWPISISLANIPLENRRENYAHQLIGLLPILDTSKYDREKRSRIFHKCMNILMEDLKRASFNSMYIKNPFGDYCHVIPMLYAVIGDYPEQCLIICIHGSNLSNFPCPTCMCSKLELSNMDLKIQYRDEYEMKILVQEMENLNPLMSKEKSKEESLLPIKPYIWDFNGWQTDLGNSYRSLMVEQVHQADLGIQKHIFDCLRKVLPSSKLSELDSRLESIRESTCIFGFRIPSRRYFQGERNIQAYQHRAILQVVCVCVQDVVESRIVKLFRLYHSWYVLACRNTSYSDQDLLILHDLSRKLVESLKMVFGKQQKSEFNLIKIHAILHYIDSIKRAGATQQYSANMWEHLHISQVKYPWRRSNKRDAEREIIGDSIKNQLIFELDRMYDSDEENSFKKEKSNALQQSISTGFNVLSSPTFKCNIKFIHCSKRKKIQCMNDYLTNCNELKNLKEHVEKLIFEEGDSIIKNEILVHNSMAIPPGGDNLRFECMASFLRAMPNFHKRAVFNDVAIQSENEGEPESEWYARIYLIFSCSILNSISNETRKEELCFVRYFNEVHFGDETRLKILTWQANNDNPYGIVRADTILRPIHVILKNSSRSLFYLNTHKFR